MQPIGQVQASPPDASDFPRVRMTVEVTNETGGAMPGLPPEAFQVFEDNRRIPGVQVDSVLLGTTQVFALNTAPGLGVRDSHGRTRFDLAREELLDFWIDPEAALTGADDLSLLTAGGTLVQHADSAAELASSLDQLEPDFEPQIAAVDLLMLALDLAGDPSETASSAVILLTPIFEIPEDLPLANAVARAGDSGTAIYPIVFGTEEALAEVDLEPYRAMALATGGQLAVFSSEGGTLAPILRSILDERFRYALEYNSLADTPGQHSLQVIVNNGETEAESLPTTYEVDLQPPEVAFIQAPVEIVRTTEDPELSLDQIAPTSSDLSVLITFPDGHERPIRRGMLTVDGEVHTVNTEPPFDRFEWDLAEYEESGSHIVQATISDSQGLVGTTVELPIRVEVVRPETGFAPAPESLLAVMGVLIAIAVLAAGFTALARRTAQPATPAGPAFNPIQRPRIQEDVEYEALLIPIRPAGDPVPLTGADVVIGRDASLAAIVLDDPSVERLHARLTRQADGSYVLRDQGSVAGTWINYVLVPKSGRRLEHGDLVQMGRIEFRFQLPGDPAPKPVRVYPDGAAEPE